MSMANMRDSQRLELLKEIGEQFFALCRGYLCFVWWTYLFFHA
jgi:hypothetical protein